MHGSQVTGKTHPKSDTDVAIIQSPDSHDLDILGLYGDLMGYFKDSKIDITNITHPNPLLGFAVARHSKLLSGSKSDYDRFCRSAFFKYNDYKAFMTHIESERIYGI